MQDVYAAFFAEKVGWRGDGHEEGAFAAGRRDTVQAIWSGETLRKFPDI